MDKKESGKEAVCQEMTRELTRESLIAISYSVPDNDNSEELPSPNKGSNHKVENSNGDKDENIRSQLISISYPELPDINAQPGCPEENKA